MKIDINSIPQEGLKISKFLNPKEYDLVDELIENTGLIYLKCTIDKKNKKIIIRGKITTELTTYCSRCLDSTKIKINEDFVAFFLPKEEEPKVEYLKLKTIDLDTLYYEGEILDLKFLIREIVLLAIPMKPLCKKDCKGLCPNCGANLNYEKCSCEKVSIDPRWAKLKELKLKN